MNNTRATPTCPCKCVPLKLSSLTAAEYGDMGSLVRRIESRKQRQRQLAIHSDDDETIITPLHVAAQHGHTELVAMLLGSGLYDNTMNNQVVTPLHRACYTGATTTVRILLLHNDKKMKTDNDPNNNNSVLLLRDISFNDSQTPLHKCASGGRYLVVQLLLDYIFQYNNNHSRILAKQVLFAKDAFGHTPLDVARMKQRQQEFEIQNVKRWDDVAGGCANWDYCVQLLETAESQIKDDGVTLESRIMNDSFIPNEIKELLQGSNNNMICRDINCRRDGECANNTESWERAFQRAIMNTTTIDNENMNNSCGNKNINGSSETTITKTLPETLMSNIKTIIPPLLQEHQQEVVRDEPDRSDESTHSEVIKNIGRPCSDCNRICVALIRVGTTLNTRLVCAKCRRRY